MDGTSVEKRRIFAEADSDPRVGKPTKKHKVISQQSFTTGFKNELKNFIIPAEDKKPARRVGASALFVESKSF